MGHSFSFRIILIFIFTSGLKGQETTPRPLEAYPNNDEPFWDDLSVTWCPPPHNQSSSCFQRLPKTAYEAEKTGWNLISKDCSNFGRYNGFIYIYKDDYSMSLIYDIYGYIAGIQTNMPQKELTTSCVHRRFYYDFNNVPYFVLNRYNGVDYLTLTAYLVDPKNVCGKGRTVPEYEEDGVGNGLWLQEGDACDFYPENVPTFKEAAQQQNWDPAQCVDGMGHHDFKNMNEWDYDNCATVPPWGILYDKAHYGNMQAFIFMVFGTASSKYNRYEHLPGPIVKWVMNGDRCPNCVEPFILDCGFTTMHVFLRHNPSSYVCSAS